MNKKELQKKLEGVEPNEELKHHIKLKTFYKERYEHHSREVERLQNGK